MSNPNEPIYQGKLKRIVNLFLFSLAGISLSFVSIFLLAQFHFGRINQLSVDLSEPELPISENEVPAETFHFHQPWVVVPDEDTTEVFDLIKEDEKETHVPEMDFQWPELIRQSEYEEYHDSDVIIRPSEW